MSPVRARRTGGHAFPSLRLVALTAAIGGLIAPATRAAAGNTPVDTDVPGFTAPSREATLAAIPAERITRYLVEEGATVAAGDLLVELDDARQRAKTETARRDAKSTAALDLARLRMEQAVAEYERLDRLASGAMTSVKELSDARYVADAAKLEYELAVLQHKQTADYLTIQEQLLAQLQIRAPFDGFVVECLKETGETVEEREGMLRLAQINPLTVTVDCPLSLARSVRAGDRFTVEPIDQRWSARGGTVRFVNRVADAASQTFKVKLEVPNDDGQWIAGTRVSVKFGDPLIAERHASSASVPATDKAEEDE